MENRRRLVALAAIAVVAIGPKAAAQLRSSASLDSNPSLTFDVASIKRNTSSSAGSFVGRRPGGLFVTENARLREVIRVAYQLQPFQLVGGPDWLDTDRWDIVAKLDRPPVLSPPGRSDDTMLALQSLLADRFKLNIRREVRQLPIYRLVVSRVDRRLGPELHQSPVDCAALRASMNQGGTRPSAAPDGRVPCALLGRVGSVQSSGSQMSEFADMLADRVQRLVVDRTELAGGWDFTLTYSPDPSQIPPGVLLPGAAPPPIDPNAPSLFTALEEQLGLKLESARGPVDVIVIDNVERPTPD